MRILLVITLVLSSACSEDASSESFFVRFNAQADGEPLAGVLVRGGSIELGRTSQDGVLDVTLTGEEGQSVRIEAECPSGYRSPEDLAPLVLRRLRQVDERERARARIQIPCHPEERIAMLLVRAGGLADLPVMIEGREMARTDVDGLAHVPLTYPPHTSFEVVLRTDGQPELSPQNPPRRFTMPDSNEIFVFDQEFARPVAEPVVRRPRPRPSRIPQRIP